MCMCPKSSGAEECGYFSQNFFSVTHRHVRYQRPWLYYLREREKVLVYLCLVLFSFPYYLFWGVVFVYFVYFLRGAWKPDWSIMHKTMLVLLSLSPGTFSSDHRALALCDLLYMSRTVAEECTCQVLSSGTPSLSRCK